MKIIKGKHLPNIIDFPIEYVNSIEIPKFNNIIYYDENLSFIEKIHEYSSMFEKHTPGAFILCTSLDCLKILKKEIIKQFEKDERKSFNLITTGSKCKMLMDFINDDNTFQRCIKNICVY